MSENNEGLEKSPQDVKGKLKKIGVKFNRFLSQPFAKPKVKDIKIQPSKTYLSEDREKSSRTETEIEEFVIIPPDPVLLKEALSIDPRVKYLPLDAFDNIPGNIPMRTRIAEELKGWRSPRDVAEYVYNHLVNLLAEQTFEDNHSVNSILIRGSAVNIGQTFTVKKMDYPSQEATEEELIDYRIKGMKDVVETGNEVPWEYTNDVNKGKSVDSSYLLWKRGFDKDALQAGYTGKYAYAHSKNIRDLVPLQKKHLIFPIFLTIASSGFNSEPNLGFYILDRIEIKKSTKSDSLPKNKIIAS